MAHRIPSKINVSVIDFSEMIIQAKENIDSNPKAFNMHEVEFLHITENSFGSGIVMIGNKAFIIDRCGSGKERNVGERFDSNFIIYARMIDSILYENLIEENIYDVPDLLVVSSIFPISIPYSILINMPIKTTERLEDWIINFSDGMDKIYYEWVERLSLARIDLR